MPSRAEGHWMDPQAVPRGFLRLYVLLLLSKNEERGYSLIQAIDEKTEGAWRPGPGTIYPLLRSLQKEALVKPLGSTTGKEGSITYAITEKGRKTLDEMQYALVKAGKRERVMFRLFADLLPPTILAPMFVRRQRDAFELFEEAIEKVPPGDRTSILKELQLVLETQLSWVESRRKSSTN